MLSLLFVFSACNNLYTEASLPKDARRKTEWHQSGPLPRAFGSPQNVDPNIDCVIKNVAWEYAKKLIPRVRISRVILCRKTINLVRIMYNIII